MTNQQLYNAFNKFTKGVIKKNGYELHLTHVGFNDKGSTTFYFDFTLLDDISYQKSAIENDAWEDVVLFYKVIGLGTNTEWEKIDINVNVGDNPIRRVTDDFKRKLKDILDNIKSVHICRYDMSECVKIDIIHKNTKITFRNEGEYIFIENFVKPIKAYEGVNNDDYKVKDIYNAIEIYKDIQHYQRFADSDTNYASVDELIGNTHGFNDDNQIIYVLTRFEDEGNN